MGDPAAAASDARAIVRALDSELPVYDVSSLEHRLSDSLGRRRLAMWLLIAFGSLALVPARRATAVDPMTALRES